MSASRVIEASDRSRRVPIYAVWEITLRCDHACAHCGSRAARARPDELSTAELLEVADALAGLGTREVTLIGGEAYLRDDCVEVVRRLVSHGIRVGMQTGGRQLTRERCRTLRQAGLASVGVSVDGPEAEHDTLRASPGSHRAAIEALHNARSEGLTITSNSQVNRLNRHRLRETRDLLRATGVRAWRAQLTVPMGRAAEQPEWILQPWQVLAVIDELAALQVEEAERTAAEGLPPSKMLDIRASNNLGYFGPHEELLRSRPGARSAHWAGCNAGRYSLGIESNGDVKGCPSLPSAPYVGGNVRDLSLEQIWAHSETVAFTTQRTVDELWGFCKTCYYADTCRGGCSFTAHCTLGRRGNNPLCYHRAMTLKGRGRRERLVQVEPAAGLPYDFGRFEVVEEDWPSEG